MRNLKNKLVLGLLISLSFIFVIPLGSLIFTLIANGIEAFSFSLITQLPGPLGEIGGFAHAIQGSLIMLFFSSLFTIPLGLLAALYLSETRSRWLREGIIFTVDMLNGAPSIIIGIYVYFLVVIPMKRYSAFAGSIALSIIVFPIIIKSSYEILRLLPISLKHAGYALGLRRWQVSIYVVLLGARRELLPGVLNAIARASGETAPLLFTAFGSVFFIKSVLEPTSALPLQIYQYATSPYPEWNKLAWSASLLLVLLIFGIQVIARFLTRTKRS